MTHNNEDDYSRWCIMAQHPRRRKKMQVIKETFLPAEDYMYPCFKEE